MINLPAICEECETIFPSGISGGGGSTFTINNSKSGPCPKCGSMGFIPDGTYRLIDNFIEILSAPTTTVYELKKLSKILQDTKFDKITPENMEKEIKEETPKYSTLLDLLPRGREEVRSDIKFFLTIIISIITIIVTLQSNDGTEEEIEVEQIINNVYEVEQNNAIINTSGNVKKTGRNELCPCGSEIKYKKCHGQ